MKIGERLKRLRMINSLTQEELASRADLTKGYISQLENDATSPSIATLKDILDVVGVSMQEFFSETTDEDIVFGKDARVQATDDDDKFRVELLVPGAQNREMDPVIVTLDPGGEMDEQPFHEGEEFGFVLLEKSRSGLMIDCMRLRRMNAFISPPTRSIPSKISAKDRRRYCGW